MRPGQRRQLASLVSAPVQWECPLAPYTTFAIGGPATALVRVEKRAELAPLLFFLAGEEIPWRVIGRGSNLLVSDEGFPGAVLLLGSGFQQIAPAPVKEDDSSRLLLVGAGAGLAHLAHTATREGLSGVEFAAGIPGTVGGAVVMNAGAWGADIGSLTAAVWLVSADGGERLSAAAGELQFAYRSWPGFLPWRGRAVVVAVQLCLHPDEPERIAGRCRKYREKRQAGQPSGLGSAGSFFKNPSGDSAGRLIEACGLKGVRVGGAMVSERHGNFLVNTGGATARDVLQLMELVRKRVKEASGVELEPEVHLL